MSLRIVQPRLLLVKILVIFLPVFAVAHLTQNMVYVLPTLAIGVFIGGSLKQDEPEEEATAEFEAND